jgi:hypothetical protein
MLTLVKDDSVAHMLGEAATRTYIAELEAAYVPNVRHSEVSIPKKYQKSNATPIVARALGEQLRPADSLTSMNPYQLERLDSLIGEPESYGLDLSLRIRLAEGLRSKSIRMPFSGSFDNLDHVASVNSYKHPRYIETDEDEPAKRFKRIVFLARPIMFLVIDNPNMPNIKYPAVMSHEFTHVAQCNNLPVIEHDESEDNAQRLRQELEAYHAGANFEHALILSDFPEYFLNYGLLSDTRIEYIRQLNETPGDPFDPNPVILQLLAEHYPQIAA